MKPIEFKIPGVPLSYNQHFQVNYYQRQIYLTKEARTYRLLVKIACPPVTIPPKALLALHVDIHSAKWFTKKGTVRRIDLPNLDKLLIDAIAEKMGFDDSTIWDSHFRKVEDTTEYTLVRLSKYVEQVETC